MGHTAAAVLLGLATIAVLVIYRVIEKQRQKQFRQELLNRYREEK